MQIEALLKKGIAVDTLDSHGNTFFLVAAQNGNKRISKLALRQGANIDHQNVSIELTRSDEPNRHR